MKILALVGGISKGSINKKLYRALKAMAPQGMEIEDFDIASLPFFTQDMENDPPDLVKKYKERIKESEAVLFVSPEYNRSFPGVLKNAIDWGSRPYGQNLWNHKPAGVIGASIGNIGTFGAQHHLRQVLAYLNMNVMGQPECYLNVSKAFNDQGELTDENVKKLLQQYWEAYSNWIKKEKR
ncbi:NADPH-dependent FMN reductase [Bdellovibrio bacteriovorus]|uniref:NADPH-dependent FMN reductase n=1 Tax=Bdellovibrio bacteriovorus TaxID=959 RepID=UPI0035A5EEBC